MPIAGCFGFVVIRENDDDTWQILEDYSMLPPNYSCGMKGFKYFIQPAAFEARRSIIESL